MALSCHGIEAKPLSRPHVAEVMSRVEKAKNLTASPSMLAPAPCGHRRGANWWMGSSDTGRVGRGGPRTWFSPY